MYSIDYPGYSIEYIFRKLSRELASSFSFLRTVTPIPPALAVGNGAPSDRGRSLICRLQWI